MFCCGTDENFFLPGRFRFFNAHTDESAPSFDSVNNLRHKYFQL